MNSCGTYIFWALTVPCVCYLACVVSLELVRSNSAPRCNNTPPPPQDGVVYLSATWHTLVSETDRQRRQCARWLHKKRRYNIVGDQLSLTSDRYVWDTEHPCQAFATFLTAFWVDASYRVFTCILLDILVVSSAVATVCNGILLGPLDIFLLSTTGRDPSDTAAAIQQLDTLTRLALAPVYDMAAEVNWSRLAVFVLLSVGVLWTIKHIIKNDDATAVFQ